VGKGALFAPCPRGLIARLARVGTLRFAHPTDSTSHDGIDKPAAHVMKRFVVNDGAVQ
jgi:hypothetical protein